MSAPAEEIRPDELDGLFARFFANGTPHSAALAVSGGSDSTALMVLFADWLRQSGSVLQPAAVIVLTVDHGLRPESAAEAREVAARAAALGFRHAILTWQGPKPSTGIQAAARAARYRLIAEYAQANGVALVLTGHTADDQAETLIMRLARGSGLDGLAAMAPLTEVAIPAAGGLHTLTIARPLLEMPKARLRATLESRSIPWIEDPSNENPGFERTRLRAAGHELAALGLTTDMLNLSVRRLRRAREAIEHAVADFCAAESTHVAVEPWGVIRIGASALRAAPAEIAVRVLSWAVAAAGGSEEPVPLAGIEAVAEALRAGPATGAWTLARAKIVATPETIFLEREPGREPPPALTLEPGTRALWDGRFLVAADPRLPGPLEVRALGPDGVREVRKAVDVPTGVSATALRTLPGFWRGGRLIAAPSLAFFAEGEARGLLSATFRALGRYNPGPAAEETGSA
jgi:tRNA(Ile)-lysidine synthase